MKINPERLAVCLLIVLGNLLVWGYLIDRAFGHSQRTPQIENLCLRTRTIMQPMTVSVKGTSHSYVTIIPVTWCDLRKQMCWFEGKEVSPSLCKSVDLR